MATDTKNTGGQKEQPEPKERIDLNHVDSSREEDKAINQHTDKDLQDVGRNLNEQIGGTDSTVTSEPNHI